MTPHALPDARAVGQDSNPVVGEGSNPVAVHRQDWNPVPPRAGFTLVELLVVIAIMALLMALLVMFYPSVSSQTAEANGAANVQGWFNIARQTAIRNQSPFGLRLWVQTQNLGALLVTECSYIEQPEDFSGGLLTAAGNTVLITGADVTGGFQGNVELYAVQPGDNLEVLGSGLMHSITSVPSGSQLALTTPIPSPITVPTPNYRILRAPRVLGQERLALPSGVIVDLSTNNIAFASAGVAIPITYTPPGSTPANATGAYVDVLFSPSGGVLQPRIAQVPYLAFWVRQPDVSNPGNYFAGSPTIIAVFTQTGLVGAYQPAPTNPYIDIY